MVARSGDEIVGYALYQRRPESDFAFLEDAVVADQTVGAAVLAHFATYAGDVDPWVSDRPGTVWSAVVQVHTRPEPGRFHGVYARIPDPVAFLDRIRPVLSRPYEPARAGVTEAAIERQAPVLIERMEDWPGAEGLQRRLFENLDAESAERLWDWYRTSSFISCPVRTSGGRILGVLAIAASAPKRAFSREDLRVIEVFAELAAAGADDFLQAQLEERWPEVARLLPDHEPNAPAPARQAQRARPGIADVSRSRTRRRRTAT